MSELHDALWHGAGLGGFEVIDAHAHVGPWTSFYTPEPTPAQMVREMDRFGVRACCVSSLLAIAADLRRGNAEVAGMLRDYPGRFYGYVTLNPNRPLAENRAELERGLQTPGFIGIKLHPMWHAQPVDGPAYAPLWELAAELCPFVLGHSWLGAEEPEGHGAPDKYAALAERHPNVTILMGHSGGTRAGHLQAAADCARRPNLYMDLCAGEFAGMWLEELLAVAPAHKVLFASDMPFLGLGSPLGRIGYSGLDDARKRALLGGNMSGVIRTRTLNIA